MKSKKTSFVLEKQTIKTMKDIAYETISNHILSGDFAAGERLVETELSSQLNISRGPIREALMRLEQEGLVKSLPYKGTFVAEISEKETREVYVPIRRIVEQYACRQAHDILTDADYQYLRSIVDSLKEACLNEDTNTVAQLDAKFHQTIVSKCTSPTLQSIWRSLFARITLQIYNQTKHVRITTDIADEHDQLLDCFKAGNMMLLDKLLEEHIQ